MEKEVGKLHKSSHLWVLRDYSRHRARLGVGQAVKSGEFTAAGHRWEIVFYPNGAHPETQRQGYASLYLTLRSGGRVQCLHGLYLLNANGGHRGIGLFKSCSGIACLGPGELSGQRQFIKRSVLESPDSGYLREDCLRLRCTIGVLDCPFPMDHPFLRVPTHKKGGDQCKSLKEIWSSLLKEAVRCKESASALLQRELLASSISISSAPPKGKLLESVIWRLSATKLKHKTKDD
ncbi:BTB/POZ and MATH domain-containing protein 5 [Striga hermonthica]|uniref:BTB/POZ and MATH domain-containing protein 5 n=1 Tax=Striga hermonthica TaxID=68872 RepID=A0A9N7NU17_STRHE|nr:BTB/POZ and MATH domain-containing protein 5 [Striga hermonthica]